MRGTRAATGAATEDLLEEVTEPAFKIEASSCTTRAAAAAAAATEDLLQVQTVEPGCAAAGETTAAPDLFKIRAITVVGSSLFVIAQDVIGFLDTLETFLRVFARVLVRMKLDRQLSVGFLDLVLGGVSRNAEYLI